MNVNVYGNLIFMEFTPGESDEQSYPVHLPDGYSLHDITISSDNMSLNIPGSNPILRTPIPSGKIPIVDGKSPCFFDAWVYDTTKRGLLYIYINEFGGEPDINYWQKEFTPILVKRKDGTEYNIIPSDQFK